MTTYIVTITYNPETNGYRNGEVTVDAANKTEAKGMVRDDIKAGGHDRHDPSFTLTVREW